MFSKKNLLFDTFIKSLSIAKKNIDIQIFNQVKNHSTFHKWTLDYFRNQEPYNKFVLKPSITKIDKSVYNPVQLKMIPTNQLLNTFVSTNVKCFYYEIDRELASRVNDMSINHILALMDACLSEKSRLSKNSKSFKKCMEVIDELWFRRPDLTASQTIQLIYYLSIYKNKSKTIVELGLQKLLNEIDYLKRLSDEELSVLAVTTYKTSAKVYDKMLRIFAYRIEKNLTNLIQKPIIFVSLIKPLKKAKYHDPILLNRIVSAFNNKDNEVIKDVISSIHLLTYLADANFGDVKFLQQLIDSIGNIMIDDNLKHYRMKDISNYVFSISYLGLTPKNPKVCKIIINFLDQIFITKERCQSMSKTLIGICLSMWMLDYKPIKLMKFLFSNVSVADLRMPNAHKQDNRLNLLLTCAFIEQPDLIMCSQLIENTLYSMPDTNKHLGERPFLVKVFETLQTISSKLDISKVEYNFNISYLRILGIKIIKNNSKVIHVEVLDNSTCLYNTEIPNGMMKLKFRLESKLKFIVITVNHKENPISLKCHLESLLS